MVALLAILLAVNNVTSAPVDPETALDATCYGSNFYLGTGNVPFGNSDRGTTVVNEWALLREGSPATVAWIAKTYNGAFWIQFDGKAANLVNASFPHQLAGEVLKGIGPSMAVSLPTRITELNEYDSYFAKINARITPCFTKDLRLP